MPELIPSVDRKTLQQWSKLSYVELCKVITRLFISEDEIPTADLNGKSWRGRGGEGDAPLGMCALP